MPGLILVMHNQGRIITAKIGGQSVDFTYAHLSSADGSGHDLKLTPRFPRQFQLNGIRVGINKLNPVHNKFHAPFLRNLKALRYPDIIHMQPQQTSHKRLVRTMSLPRGQKGTVQMDFCSLNPLPHQLP